MKNHWIKQREEAIGRMPYYGVLYDDNYFIPYRVESKDFKYRVEPGEDNSIIVTITMPVCAENIELNFTV